MTHQHFRLRALFVFLLLSVAMAGCASSGGSSAEDGPRRGSRNLIIAEELAEVPAATALEAVRRLRSQWLSARTGGGGMIQVHVDGRPVPGGVDVLSSIQAADIQQMRFRNGRDATTLYGTNYTNGVIEVTTRSR